MDVAAKSFGTAVIERSPSDPVGGTQVSRWPLERVLFAMAGTMTLVTVALAAFVSPWWLLLTAFVGVSQLTYVAVGHCPASFVIERLFGVSRGCPR
jgi:hypothetical protein